MTPAASASRRATTEPDVFLPGRYWPRRLVGDVRLTPSYENRVRCTVCHRPLTVLDVAHGFSICDYCEIDWYIPFTHVERTRQ